MSVNGNKQFSIDDFGQAFQDFLEHVNRHVSDVDAKDLLAVRVRAFMGEGLFNTHVVAEEYPDRDLPNVHLALETYLAREGRTYELLGFAVEHGYLGGFGLSALASESAGRGPTGLMVGPVAYRSVELAGGEYLQCVQWGLYLVQDGDTHLVILVKGSAGLRLQANMSLEVMARTKAQAESLLSEIRGLVRENNIYRGKVISPVAAGFGEPSQITFHELTEVERDSIVLPEDLLARIERNTLGFARQVGRLRAAGRHVRRGLLFYGPPGTGKTLTINYLASCFRGERTIILLSAQALTMLPEAIALARALTPAMVVMEDVDLVAEERDLGLASTTVLYDLLNEMDGLSPDADILFILTTNRPKVLEPALVSRPGRIDQAFEFPLPDMDARRRLFKFYGKGLDLKLKDPEHLYHKTEGASPAFIRELLRKAALFAGEETEGPGLPPITDEHIEGALAELVISGGDLTKSLLGAGRLSNQSWTLTGKHKEPAGRMGF
ncbi:MAG: 26S protease regulatory subunit [Anaerolineae bacterium]|nr:26S protease regulatory subunit [Anaerolineae bacterium]